MKCIVCNKKSTSNTCWGCQEEIYEKMITEGNMTKEELVAARKKEQERVYAFWEKEAKTNKKSWFKRTQKRCISLWESADPLDIGLGIILTLLITFLIIAVYGGVSIVYDGKHPHSKP